VARENAAVLTVIGVDIDGRKHLIALEEGYRESKEKCCAICATAGWLRRISTTSDRLCVCRSFSWVHTSILASRVQRATSIEPRFAGSSNNPRVSSYLWFGSRHQNQTRTIRRENTFSLNERYAKDCIE
jgi:hypothetical protein